MATSEEEVFGIDSKYVSCASEPKGCLPLPADFKYSAVNISGPNIPEDPSEIIYSGCDCTLPSCGQNCPCIQRFGPSYTEEGRLITATSLASQTTADITITKPVLECNSSCNCSSECVNRMVQNGPGFQLRVFETTMKGLGLMAMEPIPRNAFVCEYAGEILTDEEAKRRTDMLTRKDMNYILGVKENISNGQTVRTNIDPTTIGNVGRFINHSCNPNLFQMIVRVDNEIPRVGLFAARDIHRLEELCYSYWGDINQIQGDDSGKLCKKCYCKSPNCTGFLPNDLSLF